MKRFRACDHKDCTDGFVYYKHELRGHLFNSVKPCPKCRGEMIVSDD